MPLKAFFKWLNQENYILYNPAGDFTLPMVTMVFFSEEQIEDILRQTTIYDAIGIRAPAIFETFYSSGIRKMELVNLKLQDINLERGTLVIFEGKCKKDRVVPIGDRACAWVMKYLDEARPTLVKEYDTGHLFLTESGMPMIKKSGG